MSTEIKVPVLPESVADATILAWQKKPGDAVKRDEVLVEVETDKVVLEVPAPADGVLSSIVADEGATVVAQELLGTMEAGAVADAPAAPAAAAAPAVASAGTTGGPASPSARNMMAEHGVDRSQVAGSGKGGRIGKADVQAHVAGGGGAAPAAAGAAAGVAATASPSAATAVGVVSGDREERRVPVSYTHLTLPTTPYV